MLNRAVAGAMARFVTGYKFAGYKFMMRYFTRENES